MDIQNSMKQALYEAFRALLESPQDLACIQAGHTVIMSERMNSHRYFFSRQRIVGRTNDGLLVIRWGANDHTFDLNGVYLPSQPFEPQRRLYLPSTQFKALFAWQEAIRGIELSWRDLLYLELRAREQFYQLLLSIPAPCPDPHIPLLLKRKLPEMSREEKHATQRHFEGPQTLEHVRKGQKVVWIRLSHSTPIIIPTKVARSTKKSLFVLPDEQLRCRLHLNSSEEIRFDRQGYRKESSDRLCLPHKGFEYIVYSEALRDATDELLRTRVHLASYEQILGLLSFLDSCPQSCGYYLPDAPDR